MYVVVIHIVLICVCFAYTRDARKFSFLHDEPGAKDFALVVGQGSITSLQLLRSIKMVNSYIQVLPTISVTRDKPKWINVSTDTQTISSYYAGIDEQRALLSGKLSPRSECSADNLHRKLCTYARIRENYRIYDPIPVTQLNREQWGYLFDFADELFNAQLYGHAEVWTYFLLLNLRVGYDVAGTAVKEQVDVPPMTAAQHRLLIRGSLILFEVSRLHGHLSLATSHAVRIIHSYDELAKTGEVEATNYGILARLRLLLSIPPSPPDYAEAERSRTVIVEDLRQFAAAIKASGTTMSLEDLSTQVSATPFNMAHQGLNDLDFQRALGEALVAVCPELQHRADHLSHRVVELAAALVVLKVGFVSSYFFDHSIGRITAELLIYLSQQQVLRGGRQYALEVYAYTIDRRIPSDTAMVIHGTSAAFAHPDSLPLREDLITLALSQYLGHRSLRLPDNITTVREVITAAQLDFLVFTDVGMEFSTYALAHSRLAPIQAAWWGHPITTGLPTIDYFLSLEDEVPAAQDHYSEQLVRFEHINTVPLAEPYSYKLKRRLYSQSAFGVPSGTSDSDTGISVEHQNFLVETAGDEAKLRELGLSLQDDLCMVLGRLFKLHPEFEAMLVDLIWRFLAEGSRDGDDGSNTGAGKYIVLIAEDQYELNDLVHGRLLRAMEQKLQRVLPEDEEQDYSAVSASAEALLQRHLRLVGYSYYHALLRSARVVLDTFPYGGCLTSHDALSHSVPMVTLPPTFIRGRFTLGLYREMNMTDLVAQSTSHYVDIVLRLLRDDDFWLEQARRIHERFGPFARSNNRKVAREWAEFIAAAVDFHHAS